MTKPTQLDRIEVALASLAADVAGVRSLVQKTLTRELQMARTLEDIVPQVTANTDAEAAAVQLLNQLHQLLIAAQNDPVKIDAIINSLATSKDALAAAIVANTPST